MSKIRNINDLRDYALDTMESLRSGTLDIQDAIAISKLIDTTINTVKTQIDYNKMIGDQTSIEFMGKASGNIIEAEVPKRGLMFKK